MTHRGRDIAALAVILLAALVMGAPGIAQGGLGWSDAPNHLFDGIFVYDFVRERPFGHAREWAEQFYLRNPTLGIVVYWPPGFALVEAAMFAVTGVSLLAARLTVVIFAVSAGWLMYSLGRRWFDSVTGLFAALLLITSVHGFLWMNDVMLEWPATFWILACVYCYERDRTARGSVWSVALAVCLIAAYMTKQTAGFILPVIVLHAAMNMRSRKDALAPGYLGRPMVLGCLAMAVAIIGGYHIWAGKYAALPAHLLASATDATFYPRHLPEIVGWPLLPVAVLGLLTLLFGIDRGARGLLFLWFVGWTVFCSVISAKEPRYFFFALPPLMFMAVRFLIRKRDGAEARLSWATDRGRIILLSALVVTQTALARVNDTGRLPRYDGAVAELAGRSDADLVLVDAVRDGQFVFDLYQRPGLKGKIYPLRASKLLYARAAREKYDYQQFVQSQQDIVTLLNTYGIRYILIESALPKTGYQDADPPPRKMLRELLAKDSRFELAKSWPLRCGDPIWNDVELRLYAYPSCPKRTSKTITLSIPAMGRDVTFTLP